MKRKFTSRILSLILAVMMCLSLLPTAVMAEGEDTQATVWVSAQEETGFIIGKTEFTVDSDLFGVHISY